MFNLGLSEIILLGVIALIFIGPQQLPEVARSIGRLLNELKRASNDFQDTFTNPIKDDLQNRLQEVRTHLSEVKTSVNEATIESEPQLPMGSDPVTKEDKS